MKWDTLGPPTKNDANFRDSRRFRHYNHMFVTAKLCPNCGVAEATCHVNDVPRCQPCANHLVNLWNEMRSNLDDQHD